MNLFCHLTLSDLRKPPGVVKPSEEMSKKRSIPYGYGF